ncbi:hypothetical protein HKD37_18G050495 [Glycine soja]
MKKKDKALVDAQVAEFFYTSVIPFNAIKNPAFLKMCEMIGKYGPGYKPLSYHDVRGKLLKQAMQKIMTVCKSLGMSGRELVAQ